MFQKKWIIVLLLFCFSQPLFAQSKATWIWYPGDMEIWLSNQVQTRRTEREAFIPPFWRLYSHNPTVTFVKRFELQEPEEVSIAVEGKYNVTIDGRYVYSNVQKLQLPNGKHSFTIQVFNDATPPAVFIKGKTIQSDKTWEVELIHNNSPDNIPSNAQPIYADAWALENVAEKPSAFKLPVREMKAVKMTRNGNSLLVDFGKETFGFVQIKGLKAKGRLSLYYGESREEALSVDSCETFDHFSISNTKAEDFIVNHSRALRFVNIHFEDSADFEEVSMLYEYLPVTKRGAFRSSDAELNKIWDVAAYTLELNTREFFLDGIKRDRWIWSGDANQSYLMNYYLYFDNPTVKRTIWAVRGADPVQAHLNTIVDYSYYWFLSIYDYYQYSGDTAFLKQVYPRMQTLMDYCLNRWNQNGMVEGLPGDWVFLDWAPISKEGELSALQLLAARSLEAMALCASVMKDDQKAGMYRKMATELLNKVKSVFWDAEQNAFVHSRKDGTLNRQVTRYPNMFAMMFGYLNPSEIEKVKNNVLLNDQVLKITTPYMRFYELEALCAIGQQQHVTKIIKDYWGGMLKEGATSFWEAYDPMQKGKEHYAMYGRPYGKSLCHAWGASPIYLLGKYYLGVKPLTPGFETYLVEPNLGGLQWMEGKVPTAKGDIDMAVTEKQITIKTIPGGKGVLRIKSKKAPSANIGTFKKIDTVSYELDLEPEKNYVISYATINNK
jgi:hypothetical protein